MADLLHADAIQQLEVALLVTSMVQVIDLHASGLAPSCRVAACAQPYSRAYMLTTPAHPPTSVLVV